MKKILLITGLLSILSCSQSQERISASAILLQHVNVVDVQNGDIIKDVHVVVDSGRISKILKRVSKPEAFGHRIDGKGQYLMPGLAEMHAHIPSPPTTQLRTEHTLYLYLANGITTIRGMLGHPSHIVLKQLVAKGNILGPRIFTSSPSLNGNSVKSVEEARSKVSEYARLNYDFLKIHPGIKLEVFEALVETARKEGISFAGHVPVDVGIVRALESGYATIDHVDGFLEGLVPAEANVAADANGFFGYNFTALADTTKIDELVKLSRDHKVWIVPTQTLFERWFAPTTADEMLSEPEMVYMPRAILNIWRQRKIESTGPNSGFDETQWQQFNRIRRKLIKSIQENGQGLLLGSDAPQLFNVPGFSIHHEMATMVEAGLTPLEVIQSGTINVAEYLGMQDKMGQIEEGMIADAILLRSNPLDDVGALKELSGVMLRGKWISKAEIDHALNEIKVNTN